ALRGCHGGSRSRAAPTSRTRPARPPAERRRVARVAALAVSLVTFALSLPLYFGFDRDNPGYQFEEYRTWMPTLGVSYHIGIDGISLLLVLLTTFLTPLALASAWDGIEDRVQGFVAT